MIWSAINHFILTYLSPVDAVFGLLAAIFSGASLLYLFFEKQRRYTVWRNDALNSRGLRPGLC